MHNCYFMQTRKETIRLIKKIDEEFNKILLTDIKIKISEAFIRLEAEIRDNSMNPEKYMESEIANELVEEKASQMKYEIISFIDSQAERIKLSIKNQGDRKALENLNKIMDMELDHEIKFIGVPDLSKMKDQIKVKVKEGIRNGRF